MDERANHDSEPAEDHVTAASCDCHTTVHQSPSETVTCRRGGEGRLPPGAGHRQAMIVEATHRGGRPPTSNKSPPRTSTGLLDDSSAPSGTLEEESDRLRTSETVVEPATDRDEDVVTHRLPVDSPHALRVAKSPSEGLLDPRHGPLAVKSPEKEPKHPLYRPLTNSFQWEGPGNPRATRSPPSACPASRVTAFSVSDILDPGKFGIERRERADERLTDARLRPAGGLHHQLWSPWMHRLELHLRGGPSSISNLHFFRGIGHSS